MLLLLLLPLGRSGSFPYFRTVRGVLPANAVTQIHHSKRPCPDPLLPPLPPFQLQTSESDGRNGQNDGKNRKGGDNEIHGG